MYFDAAEQKIAELDAKLNALETSAPVDLTGLQADVDTLKAAVTGLNSAVSTLDARLDAIASGAQG